MGGQGPAHLVSCGCAVNTSQMRLSSWSPDSPPRSRLPEGRNMPGMGLPAILVSLLVICSPSRNQMAPPHVQFGAQRPRPRLGAKNARLAQSEHQLPPINQDWLKIHPLLLLWVRSFVFSCFTTKNIFASPLTFFAMIHLPLAASWFEQISSL